MNTNTFTLLIGGEELKWRQLAQHQLMSQQVPHFSPHSKAKANYKITNLRKIGKGICDVAIAYVNFEKIHLKKMIMIIGFITDKPHGVLDNTTITEDCNIKTRRSNEALLDVM